MKKEKIFSPQAFKAVSIDREKFQIRFVMSTPEVDRHGEVIDQKGWDFSKFLLNPVVLWGHDQSIPAVGKVVGIENVNGNTEGIVQFAVKENPEAKVLFELYAEGYMSAVSVGFMNNKWMYDEENDLLTLLENELFELSLVNVPANASALAKAKTKGLDVDVIKRLNTKETHRAEDRFKNLGDEVTVDVTVTETDEEEKAEVPADPEKPESGEETDPNPEEEKTEEAADAAPSEEETKAALEVLFKSGRNVIKASVKELSNRLNDANEDNQDSSVDASPSQGLQKGFSNRHINSLVRSLLSSKG
jgi:HK97 family phage prohead protease